MEYVEYVFTMQGVWFNVNTLFTHPVSTPLSGGVNTFQHLFQEVFIHPCEHLSQGGVHTPLGRYLTAFGDQILGKTAMVLKLTVKISIMKQDTAF